MKLGTSHTEAVILMLNAFSPVPELQEEVQLIDKFINAKGITYVIPLYVNPKLPVEWKKKFEAKIMNFIETVDIFEDVVCSNNVDSRLLTISTFADVVYTLVLRRVESYTSPGAKIKFLSKYHHRIHKSFSTKWGQIHSDIVQQKFPSNSFDLLASSEWLYILNDAFEFKLPQNLSSWKPYSKICNNLRSRLLQSIEKVMKLDLLESEFAQWYDRMNQIALAKFVAPVVRQKLAAHFEDTTSMIEKHTKDAATLSMFSSIVQQLTNGEEAENAQLVDLQADVNAVVQEAQISFSNIVLNNWLNYSHYWPLYNKIGFDRAELITNINCKLFKQIALQVTSNSNFSGSSPLVSWVDLVLADSYNIVNNIITEKISIQLFEEYVGDNTKHFQKDCFKILHSRLFSNKAHAGNIDDLSTVVTKLLEFVTARNAITAITQASKSSALQLNIGKWKPTLEIISQQSHATIGKLKNMKMILFNPDTLAYLGDYACKLLEATAIIEWHEQCVASNTLLSVSDASDEIEVLRTTRGYESIPLNHAAITRAFRIIQKTKDANCDVEAFCAACEEDLTEHSVGSLVSANTNVDFLKETLLALRQGRPVKSFSNIDLSLLTSGCLCIDVLVVSRWHDCVTKVEVTANSNGGNKISIAQLQEIGNCLALKNAEDEDGLLELVESILELVKVVDMLVESACFEFTQKRQVCRIPLANTEQIKHQLREFTTNCYNQLKSWTTALEKARKQLFFLNLLTSSQLAFVDWTIRSPPMVVHSETGVATSTLLRHILGVTSIPIWKSFNTDKGYLKRLEDLNSFLHECFRIAKSIPQKQAKNTNSGVHLFETEAKGTDPVSSCAPSIISVFYLLANKRLPYRGEILFCETSTTKQDIQQFFRRIKLGIQIGDYCNCIVFPDNLHKKQRQYFCRKLLEANKPLSKYAAAIIVVLLANKSTTLSHLSLNESALTVSCLKLLNSTQLTNALYDNFKRKGWTVKMFTGNQFGAGKSYNAEHWLTNIDKWPFQRLCVYNTTSAERLISEYKPGAWNIHINVGVGENADLSIMQLLLLDGISSKTFHFKLCNGTKKKSVVLAVELPRPSTDSEKKSLKEILPFCTLLCAREHTYELSKKLHLAAEYSEAALSLLEMESISLLPPIIKLQMLKYTNLGDFSECADGFTKFLKHWFSEPKAHLSFYECQHQGIYLPDSENKFFSISSTSDNASATVALYDYSIEQLQHFLIRKMNIAKESFDWQAHNFALTGDNVFKIATIYSLMRADTPVILQGATGCGKTYLIQFLAKLLSCKAFVLDLNPAITEEAICNFMQQVIDAARAAPTQLIICFFDEVNTSKMSHLVTDILISRRCRSISFQELGNIKFAAACNPFKLVDIAHNEVFGAGLQSGASKKALYTVHPLPNSLEQFIWNFGSLTTADEQKYITALSANTLNRLQLDSYASSFSFVSNAVAQVHEFTKQCCDQRTPISLREFDRFYTLLAWFYKVQQFEETIVPVVEANSLANIKICTNLALSLTYYFRLKPADRARLTELINSFTNFAVVEDTINSLISCLQLASKKDIVPTTSLKENLFIEFVCVMNRIPLFIIGIPGTSKSFSLSLLQNFKAEQSNSKFLKQFRALQPFYLQCSQSTQPSQVSNTFSLAHNYQQTIGEKYVQLLVVLDEVGLTTLGSEEKDGTDNGCMKVLHHLLAKHNKLSLIALSNWFLDPSQMNRAVHVLRQLPPESELMMFFKEAGQSSYKNNCLLVVRAYLYAMKLLEKCPTNLFSLRDFYSFANAIGLHYAEHKTCNWDIIIQMVLRNFGGVQSKFSAKMLEHIVDSSNGGMPAIIKRCKEIFCANYSPLVPLQKALNITSSTIRRHLLVVGNVDIDSIKSHLQVAEGRPIRILQNTCFSKSHSLSLQSQFRIIKTAMKEGEILILKGMDHLYSCLFDVLNQHATVIGNSNFVRIIVEHYSEYCQIDMNFYCIIVSPTFSIRSISKPFVSRFAKVYYNEYTTFFNTHYLNYRNEQAKDILNSALQWLNSIIDTETNSKISDYLLLKNCVDSLLLSAASSPTCTKSSIRDSICGLLSSSIFIALQSPTCNAQLKSEIESHYITANARNNLLSICTNNTNTVIFTFDLSSIIGMQVDYVNFDLISEESEFINILENKRNRALLLDIRLDITGCSIIESIQNYLLSTSERAAPVILLCRLGLQQTTFGLQFYCRRSWNYVYLENITTKQKGLSSVVQDLAPPLLLRNKCKDLLEAIESSGIVKQEMKSVLNVAILHCVNETDKLSKYMANFKTIFQHTTFLSCYAAAVFECLSRYCAGSKLEADIHKEISVASQSNNRSLHAIVTRLLKRKIHYCVIVICKHLNQNSQVLQVQKKVFFPYFIANATKQKPAIVDAFNSSNIQCKFAYVAKFPFSNKIIALGEKANKLGELASAIFEKELHDTVDFSKLQLKETLPYFIEDAINFKIAVHYKSIQQNHKLIQVLTKFVCDCSPSVAKATFLILNDIVPILEWLNTFASLDSEVWGATQEIVLQSIELVRAKGVVGFGILQEQLLLNICTNSFQPKVIDKIELHAALLQLLESYLPKLQTTTDEAKKPTIKALLDRYHYLKLLISLRLEIAEVVPTIPAKDILSKIFVTLSSSAIFKAVQRVNKEMFAGQNVDLFLEGFYLYASCRQKGTITQLDSIKAYFDTAAVTTSSVLYLRRILLTLHSYVTPVIHTLSRGAASDQAQLQIMNSLFNNLPLQQFAEPLSQMVAGQLHTNLTFEVSNSIVLGVSSFVRKSSMKVEHKALLLLEGITWLLEQAQNKPRTVEKQTFTILNCVQLSLLTSNNSISNYIFLVIASLLRLVVTEFIEVFKTEIVTKAVMKCSKQLQTIISLLPTSTCSAVVPKCGISLQVYFLQSLICALQGITNCLHHRSTIISIFPWCSDLLKEMPINFPEFDAVLLYNGKQVADVAEFTVLCSENTPLTNTAACVALSNTVVLAQLKNAAAPLQTSLASASVPDCIKVITSPLIRSPISIASTVISAATSPIDILLYQLMYHWAVVSYFNFPIWNSLLLNPSQHAASYIPSCPDHPLFALSKSDSSITTFYVCECGEGYGIGNCGQAMQAVRCPGQNCNRTIGGGSHTLVNTSRRLERSAIVNPTGYSFDLTHAEAQFGASRSLDINTNCVARSIVHSLLLCHSYLNTPTNYSNVFRNIATTNTTNLQIYLLKMLKQDVETFSTSLSCTFEEACASMHGFIAHSAQHSNALHSSFSSEAARQALENTLVQEVASFLSNNKQSDIISKGRHNKQDASTETQNAIQQIVSPYDKSDTWKQEHCFNLFSKYPLSISVDMYQVVTSNAQQLQLISTLKDLSVEVELVFNIPQCVEFQQMCYEYFNFKLNLNQANSLSIVEAINTFCRDIKAKKQFMYCLEVFISVWNEAKGEFNCAHDISLPEISKDSKVILFLFLGNKTASAGFCEALFNSLAQSYAKLHSTITKLFKQRFCAAERMVNSSLIETMPIQHVTPNICNFSIDFKLDAFWEISKIKNNNNNNHVVNKEEYLVSVLQLFEKDALKELVLGKAKALSFTSFSMLNFTFADTKTDQKELHFSYVQTIISNNIPQRNLSSNALGQLKAMITTVESIRLWKSNLADLMLGIARLTQLQSLASTLSISDICNLLQFSYDSTCNLNEVNFMNQCTIGSIVHLYSALDECISSDPIETLPAAYKLPATIFFDGSLSAQQLQEIHDSLLNELNFNNIVNGLVEPYYSIPFYLCLIAHDDEDAIALLNDEYSLQNLYHFIVALRAKLAPSK